MLLQPAAVPLELAQQGLPHLDPDTQAVTSLGVNVLPPTLTHESTSAEVVLLEDLKSVTFGGGDSRRKLAR